MISFAWNRTWHGDSLEVISNEAYFRAYQKLQDEEMGPTLALVLAGGWVEACTW